MQGAVTLEGRGYVEYLHTADCNEVKHLIRNSGWNGNPKYPVKED